MKVEQIPHSNNVRIALHRDGVSQSFSATMKQAHELHQMLGAFMRCSSDGCPCYKEGRKDISMHPIDPQGRKDDNGKLRFDLLPAYPLEQLVALYTFGADKYDPWNWAKGMKWTRIYAALMRHIQAWRQGEDNDPEHKLSHLVSVAWCAFTLIEYARLHPELDDRLTNE